MKTNNIKEICFLTQTPLTQRDYDRFGVKRLTERGLGVWFLDFSPIVNPRIIEGYRAKTVSYNKSLRIHTEKDLERFFKNRDMKGLLIVDWHGKGQPSKLILKYIRHTGVKYASYCNNSIPLVAHPFFRSGGKVLKIIHQAYRFFKRNVLKFIEIPIIPDFIFAGAVRDQKRFPRINKETKIVWAHTLDYDRYLDYQRNKPAPCVQGRYAVFFDECAVSHPDYHVEGNPPAPYAAPEEYYDEIDRFFSYLENKLGIPIVIAEHPKRTQEDCPNMFKGRKVFRGKTVELVAKAEYVVSHGSTAINFAVLMARPMIFLMPKKFRETYYGRLSEDFAKQFNKVSIDVDQIAAVDLDDELAVNCQLYLEYKENYIKRANTPEHYFWDIVADSLKVQNAPYRNYPRAVKSAH